jgi:hypothetical protein
MPIRMLGLTGFAQFQNEVDSDGDENKSQSPNDSPVEREARSKGLEYYEFGRWGKGGQVTHISKDGKLVPKKEPTPVDSELGDDEHHVDLKNGGRAPKQPTVGKADTIKPADSTPSTGIDAYKKATASPEKSQEVPFFKSHLNAKDLTTNNLPRDDHESDRSYKMNQRAIQYLPNAKQLIDQFGDMAKAKQVAAVQLANARYGTSEWDRAIGVCDALNMIVKKGIEMGAPEFNNNKMERALSHIAAQATGRNAYDAEPTDDAHIGKGMMEFMGIYTELKPETQEKFKSIVQKAVDEFERGGIGPDTHKAWTLLKAVMDKETNEPTQDVPPMRHEAVTPAFREMIRSTERALGLTGGFSNKSYLKQLVKEEYVKIQKEATEQAPKIEKKLESVRKEMFKHLPTTEVAREDTVFDERKARTLQMATVAEMIDIPVNELTLYFLNHVKTKNEASSVEYRLGHVYFYA